ncbi:MAG: hypothetical protein ABH867_00565 [Patescibacteria group bacterium]|nr:hypothetical protein [Patescibacteria group bacterium]
MTDVVKVSGLFDKLKLNLERRKKYVKEEFQAYGLMLAEELEDWKNKSLYIKLAKQTDRQLLEKARLFVKDQLRGTVKSNAKLFMWKLKELKNEIKSGSPSSHQPQ